MKDFHLPSIRCQLNYYLDLPEIIVSGYDYDAGDLATTL